MVNKGRQVTSEERARGSHRMGLSTRHAPDRFGPCRRLQGTARRPRQSLNLDATRGRAPRDQARRVHGTRHVRVPCPRAMSLRCVRVPCPCSVSLRRVRVSYPCSVSVCRVRVPCPRAWPPRPAPACGLPVAASVPAPTDGRKFRDLQRVCAVCLGKLNYADVVTDLLAGGAPCRGRRAVDRRLKRGRAVDPGELRLKQRSLQNESEILGLPTTPGTCPSVQLHLS